MFMPLYEFLIDPLGLPIAWYWEYIILWIIDLIAYNTAFSTVGDMYNAGMNGRGLGSFIHCIIRTFCFGAMWAITYCIIWLCKWLCENWLLIFSVIGCATFILGISVLIVKIKKNKKKGVYPNEANEKQ